VDEEYKIIVFKLENELYRVPITQGKEIVLNLNKIANLDENELINNIAL
jgi:chemotaxis signal transduction protein